MVHPHRASEVTSAFPINGGTIDVDSVYGSDSTGSKGLFPFKTIAAALVVASSGDLVYVGPGIYNLSSGFTMPANVTLKGAASSITVIQMLGVSVDTTLVTMSQDSRIEDVAFRLTSSSHVTLIGSLWPSTTSISAKMRRVVMTVDNSTASAGGTSNVYAIRSTGSGIGDESVQSTRACSFTVNSIGLGNKRALFINTSPHVWSSRETDLIVNRTGAAVGSYIAAEIDEAGSTAYLRNMLCKGPTGAGGADISQTLGSLFTSSSTLFTNNSNGLAWTSQIGKAIMSWASESNLPAGATRYLRLGSGTETATESATQMRISAPTIIKNLSVRCRISPGGAVTDTITIRRRPAASGAGVGTDTILTCSLVGAALVSEDLVHAVSFDTGDLISVSLTTGGGSAITDVIVSIEKY